MTAPYETGRLAALQKYAGAATGALTGGLLGTFLPTVTGSVWERPLRALGGATLGSYLTADKDQDGVDAAKNTALAQAYGAVLGGAGGAALGTIANAKLPSHLAKINAGTIRGLYLGGTLGGLAAGTLGAKLTPSKEKQNDLGV